MKILVTGATGFVGRELVRTLSERNHDIVILSRSLKKAHQKMTSLNLQRSWENNIFEWKDPLKELVPEQAWDGVEGVIHLMGENIAAGRWTKKRKEKIFQSRVQVSKNLVASLKKHGASVRSVVSASAIGIYPVNSESELTEESALATDGFLAEVCRNWEESFDPLRNDESPPRRVVLLRTGIVFGKSGGALGKLLPLFKLGLGGPIGKGLHSMSWIHVKDLAALYATAIEEDSFSGVYNAVAPQYVTNREFTKALSKALGRPAFFPVPPLMLKALFGEMSCVMLDSQKIVSKKSPQTPFSFQFPQPPRGAQRSLPVRWWI